MTGSDCQSLYWFAASESILQKTPRDLTLVSFNFVVLNIAEGIFSSHQTEKPASKSFENSIQYVEVLCVSSISSIFIGPYES